MNETARKCPGCGFGIGSGTESGKCPGCGMQVDPHPDHEKPAPGFPVEPDDPHIVTDEDVERYPELAGVVVVHELEYDYGRGIGAEPHGYITLYSEQSIHVPTYVHAREHARDNFTKHCHEERQYECPECGSEVADYTFTQDRAAIAGGRRVSCPICDYTYLEEHWA